MKFRIIIENQKFVPQVKDCWWTPWQGMCDKYDTMEEAKEHIRTFQKLIADDGKVVWEGK
jgi:hypothetical protein